jgi:hypothetical protein
LADRQRTAFDGAIAAEELSKLLTADGYSGTIVNGGTGGYSSNQELIKLIRDGLEFKPDIVISYSGINDMGKYNELPYPMVHPYQDPSEL